MGPAQFSPSLAPALGAFVRPPQPPGGGLPSPSTAAEKREAPPRPRRRAARRSADRPRTDPRTGGPAGEGVRPTEAGEGERERSGRSTATRSGSARRSVTATPWRRARAEEASLPRVLPRNPPHPAARSRGEDDLADAPDFNDRAVGAREDDTEAEVRRT
jgi:hypothetical protein